MILESLRAKAERFQAELFEFFRWPMAQILEDSPLLVAERDPEDQFRTWLKLWPAGRGGGGGAVRRRRWCISTSSYMCGRSPSG